MLANVMDMEEAAMAKSVDHPNAALLLFDFAAAFPSVSQKFILATLRHLGLPPSVLGLVTSLYHDVSIR